MIIDDENFKQKIIDEINSLMKNKSVKWKALAEDNNDFMTSIKYSYKPNPKRNETKSLSFGYRVCCFNYIPRIIVYDYAYKNGPTESSDMPCIEVSDKGIKNSNIFNLLSKIEETIEKEKQSKDEKLLDKLTWYLNNKKRIDTK